MILVLQIVRWRKGMAKFTNCQEIMQKMRYFFAHLTAFVQKHSPNTFSYHLWANIIFLFLYYKQQVRALNYSYYAAIRISRVPFLTPLYHLRGYIF